MGHELEGGTLATATEDNQKWSVNRSTVVIRAIIVMSNVYIACPEISLPKHTVQ